MKRHPSLAVWIVLGVFALVAASHARAQQKNAVGEAAIWKAGFGRAKVSPESPVRMWGYGGRTKPSAGVEADIWIKALALEDGAGKKAVLVTCDFGGTWGYFTDPVARAVGEKAGIPPERFLFTSSHNHSGPTLSLDEDAHGSVTKADAAATAAYTRGAQQKLEQAVLAALDDLRPARLSWGVGLATFVMNRREFTSRGIILGFNPRGAVDRSVPVLRVESPGGELRGVVFGCACHNTTLGPRNLRISGDYAGFAQEYIEAEHPGVQAMFVTGCAGDANPYPRGGPDEWSHTRAHGRTLGSEVCRVLETKLDPVRGPLTTAYGVAKLPLESRLTREQLEQRAKDSSGAVADNARSLLQRLERGDSLPDHQDAPVSVWQFGDDLTLVALSGEVVVDYVYDIEQAIGPRKLWVAAYAHEVFGYVTSARVQREGGYESKGITAKGLFAPQAEQAYVAKVRELAGQAGRTP